MSAEERKEYRRNYYIENKDRELQLMKEYRENNKDAVKEMQKSWRENNPEVLKGYNKKFYEQNTRDAVYMLISKDEEVLYIGSTNNLYKRINEKHICGWSHLKLDKDRWKGLNCSRFDYSYLDGLINSKEERLYIEKILINRFNPILNEYEPIKNNNISEERKAELEMIVDSLIFKVWKEK